ncbi:MAG: response regulator [Chloroflexi bacterium]|nr:response regulator [Chloroflexota bacterium]
MVERDETILLVDDEESILSSLRRLFRPDNYHICTALSAEEGLAILDQNPVWLVISDNGMPRTNGVQFLKEVRDRWPDVVRVMLTGYADLNSAMEAINRGEVYRFVTKPWDPEGLRLLVREGLEHYRLVQENTRMRALIEEQNAKLKRWNESLQQTVEERTKELKQRNEELAGLYRQLKGSFVEAIKVFTGLIELRDPTIGGHARRVAGLSKSLAAQMALREEEAKNVEVGALLHDIGKIGIPDEILRKNERLLSAGEQARLRQHPILGQAALQIVDHLDSTGVLIRHHHERWDGHGYPDELKGEAIPLGSRIIAVANAFDHHRKASSLGLADFVESQLGLGYNGPFDPAVILALKGIIDGSTVDGESIEVAMDVSQLREGLVLARDLRTSTGILLISKGETLKRAYLLKLILYERQKLIPSTVYVYHPRT